MSRVHHIVPSPRAIQQNPLLRQLYHMVLLSIPNPNLLARISHYMIRHGMILLSTAIRYQGFPLHTIELVN